MIIRVTTVGIGGDGAKYLLTQILISRDFGNRDENKMRKKLKGVNIKHHDDQEEGIQYDHGPVAQAVSEIENKMLIPDQDNEDDAK